MISLSTAMAVGAVCVVFQAFFSGSEIALVSASRSRLRQRAADGDRSAARVEQFLAALEREPYSPPTTDLPAAELLDHMEESGLIVQTRAGVVFAAGAFAEMQERALGVAASSGQVTLAEVRDLFSTSRKYAQAFLEHLDDLKLTRRVGDARVLRER